MIRDFDRFAEKLKDVFFEEKDKLNKPVHTFKESRKFIANKTISRIRNELSGIHEFDRMLLPALAARTLDRIPEDLASLSEDELENAVDEAIERMREWVELLNSQHPDI